MKTKEEQQEYSREWNRKNKEKVKEQKRQYYLNNREKVLSKSHKYYSEHPETIKARTRLYRQKPEVIERRRETEGKRRKENPKKFHDYQHKRNLAIRIEVLKYYSNNKIQCVCCLEKELHFLTIDHINNNGAEHRRNDKGARTICAWLKTNNFPDGYQVLCMNCNFAKGKFGICPHKKGGE